MIIFAKAYNDGYLITAFNNEFKEYNDGLTKTVVVSAIIQRRFFHIDRL